MMRNLKPGFSENAPKRPGCGTSPNTGSESRFHPAAAICSPTWTAAPSAVAARYARQMTDIGYVSPVGLESWRRLASSGRYGVVDMGFLRVKDSACRISP